METNVRLNQLSASDAAAAIASGKVTSEALIAACLERIAEREDTVRAWAFIDPELALKQARQRDRESPRSRLHGIPIGVKDVFDTCGMPTEYGSPIYAGNQPACDAACVAQVREAGGIILGKTVTTEFATRHPNKTRNPRNPAHTPGGSSSGSAAAVADDMVPIAFGTQTTQSITRPAAYCGVIGYKPTFGLINRAGLKRLSETLDTVGALTRTVPDAALIVEELSGMPPTSFDRVQHLKPRIGFCRTPYWEHADAASQSNLEVAASKLGSAGAAVTTLELPGEFASLLDTQATINGYETLRALTYERTNFARLISASLNARLEADSTITYAQYESAMKLAQRCRLQLDHIFRDYDLLLVPSAPGEAPASLETTGEPVFGVIWTTLHVPCVTLPYGAGSAGLPLGVQLVGERWNDATLLVMAEWARRTLG